MIFLWIGISLLFLFFVIFSLKIHLIFDYHDKLTVTLRILCFRFDGFSLLEKLGRNEEQGEKKSDKLTKANTKNQVKDKKIDLFGFAEFLAHLAKVIIVGLKEYFSKAKVYLKELKVSIGTDDAAETALISGTVMQAVSGLLAALQHFSKLRCNNQNLWVSPDFSSEKSSVSFHLVLTTKFVDMIGILFRTYIRFFERKEDKYARNSVKTGH